MRPASLRFQNNISVYRGCSDALTQADVTFLGIAPFRDRFSPLRFGPSFGSDHHPGSASHEVDGFSSVGMAIGWPTGFLFRFANGTPEDVDGPVVQGLVSIDVRYGRLTLSYGNHDQETAVSLLILDLQPHERLTTLSVSQQGARRLPVGMSLTTNLGQTKSFSPPINQAGLEVETFGIEAGYQGIKGVFGREIDGKLGRFGVVWSQ